VDGGVGAAAHGPWLHRQRGGVGCRENQGVAAGFLRESHQLGVVRRRDRGDPV
jgi:hypothetical protein